MLPVLLTAWGPSGTDVSAPSHTLPHTLEAGDPYYIGDVYEKSRVGHWMPAKCSTSAAMNS